MGSGWQKMVKVDGEGFKNKSEKYLSEMMCGQPWKHKDVLPGFSGLLWTFENDLYVGFSFSFPCKGFIHQSDFFFSLPLFFSWNSALVLVGFFNGISVFVYLYKMISHFHKVFYQTESSLLFEDIKLVHIVKKMQMLYCSATRVKDLFKLL